MPKGITIPLIDQASQTELVQVEHLYASHFSLLCDGAFGGGTLQIRGGDPAFRRDLLLTNPQDGADHNPFLMTLEGFYSFMAVCATLEFDFTGGTANSLQLTLYPEDRQ